MIMKRQFSKLTLFVMIILTSISCANHQTNPEKWSDEEIDVWFEKQDWLAGWNVTPDASINKRNLAIYYHKNPKHWEQAFRFLKDADLKNIPIGNQELEGKHLFVAVSEYNSKDLNETKYESHKKYIDIQYVISGEEKMGITTIDKVKIDGVYDSDKDLAFYNSNQGEYFKATPNNFLVFFPEDIHRPSVKVGESVPVKKAVVKLLIE